MTGIAALITLIASTTISAISLTESVQTASYVNELSHNVSLVLKIQESWDSLIEQKLNALQDTVITLGDQLYVLQVQSSLKGHAFMNIFVLLHIDIMKVMYLGIG